MNLCVIPARGGSKRIPLKNIKLFHGKPIISYSIEAALQSKCFQQVVVSTDSKDIASVAKRCGAEIPFFRPDELSEDSTGTIPVIKHAIEWFNKKGMTPTNVCCIYATAPFVLSEDLSKAFEQLKKNQADYCFSVTSFQFPIQRAIKITDNNNIEMFYPEYLNSRSQDLEKSFHDAGQFYWGTAEAFLQELPMFSKHAIPYILPHYRVQDIDNAEDWMRAELLFQLLKTSE